MTDYFDIAVTPSVLEVQANKGSNAAGPHAPGAGPGGLHELDPSEKELISTRDSFYLATVSESGWPFVQHRGGDAGFVRILDDHAIGWVERTGNRQYLGTGNITANGRIAAIFVDYPSRTRLKIFGRATYHPEPSSQLLAELGGKSLRADGAITVEVLATNWNCPKYITPRYTDEQVTGAIEPLRARIAELEAMLAAEPKG